METCFLDTASSECSAAYSNSDSVQGLLSLLFSKCSQSTCSSLRSCLINPSSSSCQQSYGTEVAPYGLVAQLSSKCSQSQCDTTESCLADVDSPGCAGSSLGTSISQNGLVGWVEQLRDAPKLSCYKTERLEPSKIPTHGTEIWLVKFDRCDIIDKTRVIQIE